MPTTKRNGLPFFYVTGLAKILVGDQPCELESWMKAHFEIDKRPRSADFSKWKADHTEQLQAEIARLKAEGWRTTVERYFRLPGTTAVIGGKPDVIAQADNKRPKIVDVKSGKERDSDVAQVVIYMVTIPLVWKRPDMIFEGEVVYPSHRVPVPAKSVEHIRERLFALVRRLATDVRPEASPSESSCRFCEVTEADCPQRFQAVEEDVDILTSEF